MLKLSIPLPVIVAVIALAACSSGTAPEPGVVLTRGDKRATHPDCEGEAAVVVAGLDADADGVLADSEITATTVICASAGACEVVDTLEQTTVTCAGHPPVVVQKPAADAARLVTVREALTPSECAHGGTLVEVGSDDGDGALAGNGVLDASEIDETHALCNDEDAALLSKGEHLAAHESCDGGAAVRVISGFDVDANGELADTEIVTAVVVCESAAECETTETSEATTVSCPNHPPIVIAKPATPAATLIAIDEAAVPSECAHGGYVVRSGADDGEGALAGNGVLDESEIDTTRTLCNGEGAALLSKGEHVASDASCNDGAAVRVVSGFDVDANGELAETEIITTVVVCDSAEECDTEDSTDATTVTCPNHPPVVVAKAPATLVSIKEAAVPTACAFGGFVVTSGVDDGEGELARDGVLDPSEIDSTNTLCNGEGAALLSEGERISAHASCDGGAAVRVVSGFDVNGDGELAATEIASTVVVCESAEECATVGSADATTVTCPNHPPVIVHKEFATLVSIKEAAIPSECAHGGFVVTSGADDGAGALARNGVLDASEVDSIRKLCNGEGAALLSEGERVASIASCGGGAAVRVVSGFDVNGDGELAATEIARTVVVCESAEECDTEETSAATTITCPNHPPVVVPKAFATLISIAEAIPAECPFGGFVVTSGADDGAGALARNGVLDASEIDSTRKLCNGEGAALLSEGERIADDGSCDGGAAVRVVSGFDVDGDGVLAATEIARTVVVCESAEECDTEETTDATIVTCPNHPPVVVPKDAATYVAIRAADIPTECVRGGFVVTSGADDGTGIGESGNGVLDASEVDLTSTLCAAYCGDGTIDSALGETCDDGGQVDHDGCSATCKTEPSCAPPTPHPSCIESGYMIDTIAPATGPAAGGNLVRLTGVFPAPGAGADTVELVGGSTVTATHVSTSEVRFFAPTGTGRRQLKVVVNGYPIPFMERSVSEWGRVTVVARPTVPYIYARPVVTSVAGCNEDANPAAAGCDRNGGQSMLVTGINFGTNSSLVTVNIGGSACTSVSILAPEALTCALPARALGGHDLDVVVTVDGQASDPAALVSYAAPVILPGTLRLVGRAATNAIQLDMTGSVVVEFAMANLAAIGSVTFGTGNAQFPCVVDAAASHPNEPNVIRCTTAATAVGADLHFTVKDADGVASRPGTDRLSFPMPLLIGSTLRPENCEPGQLVPDGAPFDDTGAEDCEEDPEEGDIACHECQPGSTTLKGAHSFGNVVFFDAMNVTGDASHLEVLVGVSGGPYVDRCTNVVVSGGPLVFTIGCSMPFGTGDNHVFVLRALNQDSPEGNDVFNYPPAPRIDRVSGCFDVDQGTTDCPTAGGSRIRIEGSGFDTPGLWVTVNGKHCTAVTVIDEATVECTLPEGVGVAGVVAGTVGLPLIPSEEDPLPGEEREYVPDLDALAVTGPGAWRSPEMFLLTYARPRITAVRGCSDLGTSTVDCPKEGGTTVTITGTNFGSSGALVLVGEQQCTNVVHVEPHVRLTCTMPPGSGENRAVRVINGLMSDGEFYVSYRD